jgi:phosphatidylglycerophosphate synthase
MGFGDFLVHWLLWLISPAERLSHRLRLTPDSLNFAGLLLGLGSGVLLALGDLQAGAWTIAAGGVCDILDGRIARALNRSSAYGKFIDATLDRFVEAFAFLGLVVFFRDRPLGAICASTAMAGSLLVSYTQARGETVGVSGSVGLMQRAERLVLLFVACVLDGVVADWTGWRAGSTVLAILAVMALGTFATAVYRTIFIARRLQR